MTSDEAKPLLDRMFQLKREINELRKYDSRSCWFKLVEHTLEHTLFLRFIRPGAFVSEVDVKLTRNDRESLAKNREEEYSRIADDLSEVDWGDGR